MHETSPSKKLLFEHLHPLKSVNLPTPNKAVSVGGYLIINIVIQEKLKKLRQKKGFVLLVKKENTVYSYLYIIILSLIYIYIYIYIYISK